MVHSVSGWKWKWKWGVQVKLWDPLTMRAIPERLKGELTTRRCTNPRLPLPLPQKARWAASWTEPSMLLIITSRTCGGQEAWSVNDTSGGRSDTQSCWWMVDKTCIDPIGQRKERTDDLNEWLDKWIPDLVQLAQDRSAYQRFVYMAVYARNSGTAPWLIDCLISNEQHYMYYVYVL